MCFIFLLKVGNKANKRLSESCALKLGRREKNMPKIMAIVSVIIIIVGGVKLTLSTHKSLRK